MVVATVEVALFPEVQGFLSHPPQLVAVSDVRVSSGSLSILALLSGEGLQFPRRYLPRSAIEIAGDGGVDLLISIAEYPPFTPLNAI